MSNGPEYFGKYLLLEKIATGGMAEVYLARSTGAIGITKFIAIKRILPQYSDSPEFIEMFKDEAKIAINLSHSNIVSIYEFGVEKNQFYLAMDFVEGKNLRQILNKMKKSKATLSIDQIVYIVKEVAAGLDHAHRCLDGTTGRPLNITHRDMSPQNIMVSFEGEVKIVDFGIAKAESQIETTKAGTLKGKFGYMSPEQAEGLAVDLRTDIFSLGIVLWELLANDRLFIANNEINTLRKIRECNVPSLRKINPSIPPELEKIVSKALAKDRNMRYQTSASLYKDLNRFLNRQYPDFSAQDFSIFCKTLFANEILENRKRVIEYAKIQSPSSSFDSDKTEVTATLTDGGSRPSAPAEDTGMREFEAQPSSLSLENLKVTQPPALDLKITEKNLGRVRPREETSVGREVTLNTQARAIRYRQRPSVASRILSNSAFMIAIAVLTGVGTYYIWRGGNLYEAVPKALSVAKIDLPSRSSAPTPQAAPPPAPAPAPVKPPAVTEKYTVLVTSTPAAAEISINGLNMGVLTPGTVQVEAGKPFTVTLHVDGYLKYERTEMASQNSLRIQATLQKARLGYLDINVMPAGSTVFIDGVALSERPPIRRYSVQANTEVVVRAENPITGAYDELKVSVEQDKVKKVNLFPKTRNR